MSDILKEFDEKFNPGKFFFPDKVSFDDIKQFISDAISRARSEAVGSVHILLKGLDEVQCEWARLHGGTYDELEKYINLPANRSRILKVGGEALPVDLSRVELESNEIVEIMEEYATLRNATFGDTIDLQEMLNRGDIKSRILRVKE